MLEIRPYAQTDRDACLALFTSNTPPFFHEHERAEFVSFLDDPQGTYLVEEVAGQVVACGGYMPIPNTPIAVLIWGMVDRTAHGKRYGTQLLAYRIAAIRQIPQVTTISLQTSQHAMAFFAKYGFNVTQITPDGFGSGVDQYDMELSLGSHTS